jgi:broad specificity phosphatase PhoE
MKPLIRCLMLVLSLALAPSGAGASDLSERLSGDRFVLLIRHAHAPGVGDPPGYVLERCETQRVLDDGGRRQAARLGTWLRAQGVTRAAVHSSPWCRCRQTAELLDLGPVSIEPALGSFFDAPGKGPERNADLQSFIAGALRSKGDRALILVTHQVNISAFTGSVVGTGDLVLVRVDEQGRALDHRIHKSP